MYYKAKACFSHCSSWHYNCWEKLLWNFSNSIQRLCVYQEFTCYLCYLRTLRKLQLSTLIIIVIISKKPQCNSNFRNHSIPIPSIERMFIPTQIYIVHTRALLNRQYLCKYYQSIIRSKHSYWKDGNRILRSIRLFCILLSITCIICISTFVFPENTEKFTAYRRYSKKFTSWAHLIRLPRHRQPQSTRSRKRHKAGFRRVLVNANLLFLRLCTRLRVVGIVMDETR